jgi:hypothetical protein
LLSRFFFTPIHIFRGIFSTCSTRNPILSSLRASQIFLSLPLNVVAPAKSG